MSTKLTYRAFRRKGSSIVDAARIDENTPLEKGVNVIGTRTFVLPEHLVDIYEMVCELVEHCDPHFGRPIEDAFTFIWQDSESNVIEDALWITVRGSEGKVYCVWSHERPKDAKETLLCEQVQLTRAMTMLMDCPHLTKPIQDLLGFLVIQGILLESGD